MKYVTLHVRYRCATAHGSARAPGRWRCATTTRSGSRATSARAPASCWCWTPTTMAPSRHAPHDTVRLAVRVSDRHQRRWTSLLVLLSLAWGQPVTKCSARRWPAAPGGDLCDLSAAAAQIFFDDNIGHTASHIVDARDVRTGEPLAFQAGAPARKADAADSTAQGLALLHSSVARGVCKVNTKVTAA